MLPPLGTILDNPIPHFVDERVSSRHRVTASPRQLQQPNPKMDKIKDKLIPVARPSRFLDIRGYREIRYPKMEEAR
jgi:hypothetical protein